MVMQSGMHPAAIKDSVTSEIRPILYLYLCRHPISRAPAHLPCPLCFFITLSPSPLSYFVLGPNQTAPGGCTIAGLLNLEDGKVRSTVARTIQAAAEHAAGLGQGQKK